MINDKIYLFIWFWYLLLAVLTSIAISFHFFLLIIPALRLNVFRKTLIDRKEDAIYLDYIAKHFPSFGDWFILHMLSENTDQIMYIEILKDLQPNRHFKA